MKNIFFFFILSFLLFSCKEKEQICPENLIVTAISPVNYTEVEAIFPVFEWETNLSNEYLVLETSKMHDFSEIYERAEVKGNSYQSDRVYNAEKYYYWRLRGEWCPEFLVDEVFNTSTYFKAIKGIYEAEDGTQVTILAENSSLVSSRTYAGFDVKSWSDDTLVFTTYNAIPLGMGAYAYTDAEIVYNVANQTIRAEGSYDENGIYDTLSFFGKKVN